MEMKINVTFQKNLFWLGKTETKILNTFKYDCIKDCIAAK